MNEVLLKKLKFKTGPAIVINPPEGYQIGIENNEMNNEKLNFIQLFVNNRQELIEKLANVIPTINEDAVFWITYPKQSSKVPTDLNRDIVAETVQTETEYRVVSNVAVDEKWSALRIRRQDKVKSKK
ncbi:MAG: hypothetical protein Q8934_15015 [Bacillota bacterium]|nr:hypothetical protein [Bacillota bacterium]